MKAVSSAMVFGLLGLSVSCASASDLKYDYFDVSIVDQQEPVTGQELDGYNADLGFSLGSKFYLKLGFENIDQGELDSSGYTIERIKSKRFGFGYRNSLTDTMDFVAEYTQDDYSSKTSLLVGDQLQKVNVNDNGDTTQVGLRGLLFDKLEWDTFIKRKTWSDADLDETGFAAAVRYRLVDDLSIGASYEKIDDFEQTAVGFRYNY